MVYYVTFRHSRDLAPDEREILHRALLAAQGRQLEFLILAVIPKQTEALFKVSLGRDGRPLELAKVVESAKRRAGKKIVAKSGERYPPFWEESYDRIVRDETELEERWLAILESPVAEELTQDPEDYPTLWVAEGAPR